MRGYVGSHRPLRLAHFAGSPRTGRQVPPRRAAPARLLEVDRQQVDERTYLARRPLRLRIDRVDAERDAVEEGLEQ